MGWTRDLLNIGYPSLTTPTLFKSQKILFNDRELGCINLPLGTKRRLTSSHLPILEPVLKLAYLSIHIIILLQFSPPSIPDILCTSISPRASFAKFCNTHFSSINFSFCVLIPCLR